MEVNTTKKTAQSGKRTGVRSSRSGKFVYSPNQRKRLAQVAVRANEASGKFSRELPSDLVNLSEK